MTRHNGAADELLDDEELLRREDSERREYRRLWLRDRNAGTTYGLSAASASLAHAWDRWNRTRVITRRRGLKPSAW
ncbi:MAG TPA: hypothetical protein VJ867_15120 [Gemmatimonadaceae bacterium]|nr:hypothetical protein [Gemmatimonadaceae bacterium]